MPLAIDFLSKMVYSTSRPVLLFITIMGVVINSIVLSLS